MKDRTEVKVIRKLNRFIEYIVGLKFDFDV